MNPIERAYREGLAGWSGQRRVARVASLLSEVREMIRRRIESEEPHLDERALRIRVAQSMYRSDPHVRELLAQLKR